MRETPVYANARELGSMIHDALKVQMVTTSTSLTKIFPTEGHYIWMTRKTALSVERWEICIKSRGHRHQNLFSADTTTNITDKMMSKQINHTAVGLTNIVVFAVVVFP